MPSEALSAVELHKNVPPDWYYVSIRENPFQRFWHTRRFRHVSKLAEHQPGCTVVDIGCADGVFTDVIHRATGAKRTVAYDVLPGSIAWAADHWKGTGMEFHVADAHAIPSSDASADAVFCLEMLEHVFDPAKAIREMLRVLKPGGYAVLLVPADTPLFLLIWAVWQRMRGKIWHDTHIQSFHHRKLGVLAREQGFDIDREDTFLLGMLYSVKLRKPAVNQREAQPA